MEGNYAGFHQSPARSVWAQVMEISPTAIFYHLWAPFRVSWVYCMLALGYMDIDTVCGVILSNPSYIDSFKDLHKKVVKMANGADTSVLPMFVFLSVRSMDRGGKTIQQLVSELNSAMVMWRPSH